MCIGNSPHPLISSSPHHLLLRYTMLVLALRNLARRRLRSILTLFGVAISICVLSCLLGFGEGYQRNLRRELDGMGIQMMLVPLGCPYDAAARVLKGRTLDASLPDSALATV